MIKNILLRLTAVMPPQSEE